MKPTEKKSMTKFEAVDHEAAHSLETLMRAHEIHSDPELMARVQKHAGTKMKHMKKIMKHKITSIAGLKKARNDMAMGEGTDMMGDEAHGHEEAESKLHESSED